MRSFDVRCPICGQLGSSISAKNSSLRSSFSEICCGRPVDPKLLRHFDRSGNQSLLLEDSDGWMECEGCGGISRVRYRERLMCSGNERFRHLRREEKRKTA